MNNDPNNTQTILIIGATGHIGIAVVEESVRQGFDVIANTRSPAKEGQFAGAEVLVADVSDPASIAKLFTRKVDIVISCLACSQGRPQDYDDIDYKATLKVLNAALENGANKFILLSAICIRKPDLPLQLAKLKMEDALIRSGIDYTIVRPTAYFWVFDVQTKRIAQGKAAYVVGTGDQAVHNPISKEELAEFMVSSINNSERKNRVFILGGPEVPENIITYRDSLQMVFASMGKEPKIVSIPRWVLMAVIHFTWFLGLFFRKFSVFSQFLRNTHYYLENDMRAPGYGSKTLKQYLMDTTREPET